MEKEDKKAAIQSDTEREATEAKAAKDRAETEKARAAAATEAGKPKTGFVIANGISVTCARGVIEEGQPIAPADFGAGDKGKAAFDNLVERGAIVKAP